MPCLGKAELERLAQWAGKKRTALRTQNKNSPDIKLFKHIMQMDRFQYGKLFLWGETIL